MHKFGLLATGTTTSIDWSPIITALQNGLSSSEIVAIIAAGLGVSVGMVILWWGSRKLVNMVMSAFKSGKIKF